MQTLHLADGKTAVVIVAHPDDETIWLGGTIMKHPRVQWTVFCLCRASDPDRAPKFFRVCEHYGAQPIMTDLDDEGRLSLEQSLQPITELILQHLTQPVDYLFCHGPNGEYGHPRHIGIYQVVRNLLRQGQVQAGTALHCHYRKDEPQADFSTISLQPDSDYQLALSPAEYAAKRAVMTELYGFAPDGPDTNYCTNPEGFKNIKF